MRSTGVVLLSPAVELSLLSFEITSWRDCTLSFESFVHSFMDTVLIGTAWLDQDRIDSQPNPPDGQFRKPGDPDGGEGRAVVGFYCTWQPVFPESSFKYLKGTSITGRIQSLTVK